MSAEPKADDTIEVTPRTFFCWDENEGVMDRPFEALSHEQAAEACVRSREPEAWFDGDGGHVFVRERGSKVVKKVYVSVSVEIEFLTEECELDEEDMLRTVDGDADEVFS